MSGRRAAPTAVTIGWVVFPMVAVLLAVAGWLVWPEKGVRVPGPVPVNVAAYACPLTGGVSVAMGQVHAGASASTAVLPGGRTAASLADPRAWRVTRPAGDSVTVEQRGRTAGAVGFIAGAASKADGGGLVVGSCPSVTDDAWFVGLGSSAGHHSTLTLTNFGDGPALVDVLLWAPDGEVAAVGNLGIVVKPNSSLRVPLASIAAGEEQLVVHVERRRGTLSVSAWDSSVTSYAGADSVSAVQPSRRLLIAGIPRVASSRQLILMNPATETARASVRVLGDRAPFTPAGLGGIKVPAGQVVAIALPAGQADEALEVTSDHALVAAVRLFAGRTDMAYATAVVPIERTAVVPVDLAMAYPGLAVLLTAPAQKATATLTAYDASMRKLGSTEIDIAALATVAVAPASIAKGPIAYLTLKVSGSVAAAAVYGNAATLSVLALHDAPLYLPGPDVQPAD